MEVKKGLEKEYKKYLKLNTSFKREIWASDVLLGKTKVTSDEWMGLSYNLAVVAATEAVGASLTVGKSPKEAEEWLNHFGLSIAQAGFVAQHIVKFHPRGKEFNEYWNRKFSVKGKGVAFPAVLECRKKGVLNNEEKKNRLGKKEDE